MMTFAAFAAHGGTLDEAAFGCLMPRAEAIVRTVTHGRSDACTDEALTYALTQLCTLLAADQEHGGREVTALENGGVRVNYQPVSDAGSGVNTRNSLNGMNPRYLRLLREWLGSVSTASGVPLLYCGADA